MIDIDNIARKQGWTDASTGTRGCGARAGSPAPLTYFPSAQRGFGPRI